MKTYQELIALGDDEKARGEYIKAAVNQWKGTEEYRDAMVAEAYYHKHNITMETFQKFLYTMTGNKVPDLVSANYKVKSLIFRRLVTQQVMFCLANGLILTVKDENGKAKRVSKEALGKDFDFQLKKTFAGAMVGGRAWGFWNYDHMEVFNVVCTDSHPGFCPILDENTSALRAGIRFYFNTINSRIHMNATLYEQDGVTEYIENDEGVMVPGAKQAYKTKRISNAIETVDEGSNYDSFPIVEAFANDCHDSELIGIREAVDCFDYIKNGLANQIDDSAGFYWLIKNAGGMQDKDLAQFVMRMKRVHAAVAKGDDVSAEAHTLDVPYEARAKMLEILRSDIYEDFQLLDVKTLSAAQKTTQEIQAAYQAQENKCADFEYYILDFCQKILKLAGIDADCSLNWNRIVNQQEQTNMILSAWELIGDEMAIRKLPFLTPEEAEEVIAKRAAEDINRVTGFEILEEDE